MGILTFTRDIQDTRTKTFALQSTMRQMEQSEVIDGVVIKPGLIELKVIHHFSEGVYARELHIPAGVTLVGEIHKFKNLNILSKGKMLVTTEEGMKKVEAPFTVVSPPGTKRAAHTLTDCVWTTVHGTDETNIDAIEAKFIAHTEEEYLEFVGANQLMLGFN